MRQIILDTETTGLSAAAGHRMIEVAAVELLNRRPTGRHYHQYICPQRAIDADAVAVHGITEDFLADKPPFQDIAAELLAFLSGAELVIHNAPFDVSFLDSEFKRTDAAFKSIAQHCDVLDTLALARKKHPGQQNNLDALCRRYKVDNSGRELHGALMDAHLLMQVYLAMTGGQMSLFDQEMGALDAPSNRPDTTESPLLVVTKKSRDLTLKVIKADMEECKAHEEQLRRMKEKSGVCLWGEDG